MFDLKRAQGYMNENSIDAWLVYDFRGNNPAMWQIMGAKKSTTRRSFMLIHNNEKPEILAHVVDKEQFSEVDFSVEFYTSWPDMHDWLKNNLGSYNKIAMEYSPDGAIPTMSWVDGGTLELIRSIGVEIVSSADLFQITAAVWTEEAFNSHLKVSEELAKIKDSAFDYVRQTIHTNKPLTEYDVQEFIMKEFEKRKLETEDRPIVAVNKNSGDPHYEPTPEMCSPIKKDDWVLIDLWARYPGEQNVFADITWVGYVGDEVPSKHQTVFDVVKAARDRVIARLKEAWEKDETVKGWQLDDVARDHISKAGYGKCFFHRTGHSLGPGPSLHALGVNLDNLETHDARKVLPGIGFSVEPGVYLKDFGVRLEVDVYIDPTKGPIVTTPLQEEVITLT